MPVGAYLSRIVCAYSIFVAVLFSSNSQKIIPKLHFYFHWYRALRLRAKLLIYDTNNVILNLEGGCPQVWQVNGVLREEGFGLIVADRRVDDDILTLLPVDGGGNAVLVTDLEGYVCIGEYVIHIERLICTYNRRPSGFRQSCDQWRRGKKWSNG